MPSSGLGQSQASDRPLVTQGQKVKEKVPWEDWTPWKCKGSSPHQVAMGAIPGLYQVGQRKHRNREGKNERTDPQQDPLPALPCPVLLRAKAMGPGGGEDASVLLEERSSGSGGVPERAVYHSPHPGLKLNVLCAGGTGALTHSASLIVSAQMGTF